MTQLQYFFETIRDFLDTGKPFIFTLGLITGISIVGFFEAIEYKSLYEPSVPAWVWVLVFIVSTAIAGRIMESTK